MAKTDPDSRSVDLEKVVPWTEEFNEDELAVTQKNMEDEFGISFDRTDYDLRGASEIELEPFYTGLDAVFDIYGAPLTVSVKETDIGHRMEYWSEDFEVLGKFSEWLEPEETEEEIDTMLEPYRFRDVTGTELKHVLNGLDNRTVLEGPEPRPGKGQVREYPVRIENIDLGDEENYLRKGSKVVGDGTYSIEGVPDDQPPVDYGLDGKLHIRPVKSTDGVYNLSVEAGNLESMGYIIDQVRRTVDRKEDEGDYMLEE